MADLRTREVEDLLTVFAGLTDPDDVFALLEDLFTVREIKDTSQRLGVARMLKAGSSYAVIEQATGASATTIARVSKALDEIFHHSLRYLLRHKMETPIVCAAGSGIARGVVSPAQGKEGFVGWVPFPRSSNARTSRYRFSATSSMPSGRWRRVCSHLF